MRAVRGYSGAYVSSFTWNYYHGLLLVLVLKCVYVWLCVGPQVESIDDQVREKLLLIKKGNATQVEEKEKNELKKRKLLTEV